MKQFTIPFTYRSPLLGAIKSKRKAEDKMKKDFSPYLLDFGSLKIHLARHFGFCYGVENAIEIAFRTIQENPGKRIFLLSEMIHNPIVNRDLAEAGVQFLQDTQGKQLVPFDSLQKEDIVLIPAFGTTLEIEEKLKHIGIATERYDTTCPFVEKVWNRSQQIGEKKFTVIIHGKPSHEETRATFSHAGRSGAALVIKDMGEAMLLAEMITGIRPFSEFNDFFSGRCTPGFDPAKDLERIGVVNQTTMLASDTQAIAESLKSAINQRFSETEKGESDRFADTKDTLCYATNDNQTAVFELVKTPADAAIIVGGYNSSNTSHLVEICEEHLPTFFIDGADKILSDTEILHYRLREKKETITHNYLPELGREVNILLSCGASCPDAVVEKVIERLLTIRKPTGTIQTMLETIL